MNRERDSEPNWQPISRLPVIAAMIRDGFMSAQQQLENLKEAAHKPWLLDDEMIKGIQRAYSEQLENIWVYERQLTLWGDSESSLGMEGEIADLTLSVAAWKQVLREILAMIAQ